jgi:hypothetical protein
MHCMILMLYVLYDFNIGRWKSLLHHIKILLEIASIWIECGTNNGEVNMQADEAKQMSLLW